MLNFGASKPRIRGGPGPQGPPGSAPETVAVFFSRQITYICIGERIRRREPNSANKFYIRASNMGHFHNLAPPPRPDSFLDLSY